MTDQTPEIDPNTPILPQIGADLSETETDGGVIAGGGFADAGATADEAGKAVQVFAWGPAGGPKKKAKTKAVGDAAGADPAVKPEPKTLEQVLGPVEAIANDLACLPDLDAERVELSRRRLALIEQAEADLITSRKAVADLDAELAGLADRAFELGNVRIGLKKRLAEARAAEEAEAGAGEEE
jgi:hypothetical protein